VGLDQPGILVLQYNVRCAQDSVVERKEGASNTW